MVASATHQINEEEEYYIGRAVAANILSQYPLWKNADATHYLNLIGKALVLRSARPKSSAATISACWTPRKPTRSRPPAASSS